MFEPPATALGALPSSKAAATSSVCAGQSRARSARSTRTSPPGTGSASTGDAASAEKSSTRRKIMNENRLGGLANAGAREPSFFGDGSRPDLPLHLVEPEAAASEQKEHSACGTWWVHLYCPAWRRGFCSVVRSR